MSVNEDINRIGVVDHDTLCYSDSNILYCIKQNGTAVFKYSNKKLQNIQGITVDRFSNIYVCGYSSSNIHQLDRHGNLLRIMFDNLPRPPYCISFSKDHDKVAIGCDYKVLLYKFS